MRKILILGAGNLLLSDEGFGVHFIRYLQQHYHFPPSVELLDAGTLGLMVTHLVEQVDCLYLIDCIASAEAPGTCHRYDRTQLPDGQFHLKLSPHQAGLQEMLLITELRGRCPAVIFLLGVVPESLAPGTVLSRRLQTCLVELARQLVAELRAAGVQIEGGGKGEGLLSLNPSPPSDGGEGFMDE